MTRSHIFPCREKVNNYKKSDLRERKQIFKLFIGLRSDRIENGYDLGRENASLGLQPRRSIFKTSVTVFQALYGPVSRKIANLY